jgi:hypothetical protein
MQIISGRRAQLAGDARGSTNGTSYDAGTTRVVFVAGADRAVG